MTLIVSAIRDDAVVQVSDLRLTQPNGRLVTDSAVKATCLVCDDAAVSICYCGLASVRGKRTDRWLADYLTTSRAATKPFGLVLQELQATAARTFSSLGPFRSVTFAWAGFWGLGPTFGQLSNFEDSDGAALPAIDDAFRLGIFRRKNERLRKAGLGIYGADAALTARLDSLALRKVARHIMSVPVKSIDLMLAQIIRDASKDHAFGRLISEHCLSVTTTRTGFGARYHASATSTYSYAPHLIMPTLSVMDFFGGSGEFSQTQAKKVE